MRFLAECEELELGKALRVVDHFKRISRIAGPVCNAGYNTSPVIFQNKGIVPVQYAGQYDLLWR